MVRRHRLLETFLVESLGYGWDEVHDEAEILEHAASDRLVDRIDAFLGRPQADPHGDPISDPEGQIGITRTPRSSSPRRGPGPTRSSRVSDADPAVLAHLAEAGVVPGARIDVFDGEGSGPVRAAVGAEPNDMCWTAAEQTEAGHTEAKQVEVERTVASAVYLTRA